jgi:hypothetical protein
VHGTVGEQGQDRCADVATLSASASAATAAGAAEAEASARIEAEAAAARSESGAGLKAGAEGAAPVGAVLAEMLAELTTGVPALFVKCPALLRVEPEAESAG